MPDDEDDDGELCMGCDVCDEPITGEQEFTQGGKCDECWAAWIERN